MHSFSPDETTRNRPDFVTLRDGGIALYHAEPVLADDVEWFRQAGYAIVEFDGAKWTDADRFFASFATALHFPSYFGRNLDAFDECLSEDSQVPEQGLLVVVRRIDAAVGHLSERFVQTALDMFSRASHEQLLYGRRLISLLQSANPRIEFKTIEARPVAWNSGEFPYSSRRTE